MEISMKSLLGKVIYSYQSTKEINYKEFNVFYIRILQIITYCCLRGILYFRRFGVDPILISKELNKLI